jgi:hypothetical protein
VCLQASLCGRLVQQRLQEWVRWVEGLTGGDGGGGEGGSDVALRMFRHEPVRLKLLFDALCAYPGNQLSCQLSSAADAGMAPPPPCAKGNTDGFHRVLSFYVRGSRFTANHFTDPQDYGFPAVRESFERIPPTSRFALCNCITSVTKASCPCNGSSRPGTPRGCSFKHQDPGID